MSEQAIALEQPKHPGGRPPIYTEDTVRQLIGALQLGLSVTTACDVAGISRDTYYAWLKEKEEFSDKVTKAQHHATILAANIVGDVLQDSLRGKIDTKSGKQIPYKYGEQTRVNTAKWMLEKKERQGFGSQTLIGAKTETDGKGGVTTTIVHATDGTFTDFFKQADADPGSEEIDPGQFLEILEGSPQGEETTGGGTEEPAPPIHTEELQGEHSSEVSVPEP